MDWDRYMGPHVTPEEYEGDLETIKCDLQEMWGDPKQGDDYMPPKEIERVAKELGRWAADIRADEADEPEEPFKYAQAERRTVTMYPSQWRAVDDLARKRHRGKKSPALQEIVDWYMLRAVLKLGGKDDR